VHEHEVHDTYTVDPSFSLEYKIMRIESQLANLKYPEFSR
jgi:hypothetical protein